MTLSDPCFQALPREPSGIGWLREVRTIADLAHMSLAVLSSSPARAGRPIRVPIRAIVSPSDAVVDPAATVDRVSADVRHVAIDAPHVGLVFNPRVWRLVLEALDEAPVA